MNINDYIIMVFVVKCDKKHARKARQQKKKKHGKNKKVEKRKLC